MKRCSHFFTWLSDEILECRECGLRQQSEHYTPAFRRLANGNFKNTLTGEAVESRRSLRADPEVQEPYTHVSTRGDSF